MAKLRKPTANRLASSQSTSKAFKPISLTDQLQTAMHSTAKVSAAADLTKLSNSMPALKGIQFGSPSHAGAKSQSSSGTSNEWANLLKAASDGAASLIGGGFLQSGITSLISGLTSLFDSGNKSEAPLVRFNLPDPQQQTMYVTRQGLTTSSSFQETSQGTPSQGPVYKQSEIVQAVKNALLTSSSLNDVIAEI